MEIPTSGIVRNLPSIEYHAHPSVSSSILKNYLKYPTPAHAKFAINNPHDSGKEALLRGSVVHTLLLEPHRIDLDYVIEYKKLFDKTKLVKNGGDKETWDAMKKQADEKLLPIVPHSIWVEAKGMAESIQSHEYWQLVGKRADKEFSLFSTISGVPVRARYDALYGRVVLDIKTCRFPLTDAKIDQVIASEKYHISAAMYLEVGKSLGIEVDRFVWVFVESFKPHLCRFVEASKRMLDTGRDEFYYALEKHKECTFNSVWPGYPNEIRESDLPDWYESREAILHEESEGTA